MDEQYENMLKMRDDIKSIFANHADNKTMINIAMNLKKISVLCCQQFIHMDQDSPDRWMDLQMELIEF